MENNIKTLTESQRSSLKAALTMSKANGFDRPGCSGSAYRSLEARGLMVSSLLHGVPAFKGGGTTKRTYRLTDEGRAVAEAL